MNNPLVGVRILGLTHLLAGQDTGMILADLGAKPIKAEPLTGEKTRKLRATDPENSLNGMSIIGSDWTHPVRAGIPIGDLGGGMLGVMGILAALYDRER